MQGEKFLGCEIVRRIVRKQGRLYRSLPDDVEDCCQEIDCTVLDRFPEIDPEKWIGFVVKTAMWNSRRFLRGRKVHRLSALPDEPRWAPRHESGTGSARIALLREAIERLPAEHRAVIEHWLAAKGRSSAVNGWAEKQEYSRSKAYKLFREAKAKIRAYIREQEGDYAD